jgi:type IV secretory pathway VirJ component
MKWLMILPAMIACLSMQVGATQIDSVEFGRFGKVALYQPQAPTRVILFISGDGGWNLGVVDMARSFAEQGALVIGVDIIHYLQELEKSSEKCSYPAGDLEMLSQYIQKKLNLPMYINPVLIGYSSGATLVYAALVQAPPNTFAGAISMGFCPDLPVTKPFCRGNGLTWGPGPKGKGVSFLPASNLSQPWIAFQGIIDQVCSPADVEAFVKEVKNGQVVMLPKVGHGFSVQKNWLPQLREALLRIEPVDSPKHTDSGELSPLKDLPLVELPVADTTQNMLAVIISGDGGWASIDKKLGDYFSSKGVPVVGLNSLRYFWNRRTPDSAAMDLNRIITHYLTLWKKEKALLVGYSRGADVLPFMTNRLPAETLGRVRGVVFLGLEDSVDFQFHLSDWVSGSPARTALPVKPELEKLRGLKLLCFCGREEDHSLCRELDTSWVKVIETSGGHHFGGDYESIAKMILGEFSSE